MRCVLIATGLALSLAAGPAQAQWFGGFEADMPIPPQGIVRMLMGRGFSAITRPRFDGDVYRVEGTNRFGERVRLTIDAYDGGIVGRTRLAHAGGPFGDGLLPPRDVGRGRVVPEEPFAPPWIAPADRPRAGRPGSSAPQQALRAEPPVGKPAAPRPEPRSPEARPVQPRLSPTAPPAPALETRKPKPPSSGKPAETAAAPAAPVRVIGGVTPMNPNEQPAAAKPVAPAQPAATPETPPL